MIKRVYKLKKQSSVWDIVSEHIFTYRHYQVDEDGNFYRNNEIKDVKPDRVCNKWFLLIDDDKQRVRFKAHQIILQTFDPEGLVDGVSVDHRDKNRLNNSLINLRYATHEMQAENRENTIHKYKKVKCLNNGITYQSCLHAEVALKLIKNTCSRVARGDRKSIHGYKFYYV